MVSHEDSRLLQCTKKIPSHKKTIKTIRHSTKRKHEYTSPILIVIQTISIREIYSCFINTHTRLRG